MNQVRLPDRLRNFRQDKGLSQEELATLLGVRKITVFRWENGTSVPSPLAAERLQEIGFGGVDRSETKQVSIPRLALRTRSRDELREDVRKTINLSGKAYAFDPSPYVVNGPEDQLPFFETLYGLQELSAPPGTLPEYARRLSLVATIPELGISTAQHSLERPKLTAQHWDPNYGPHGWHRYVGRFPPHLVRAIINHFGARRGDTICDPFSGSGTTLVESRLLGLKAVGIEICPLSSLISRTKSKFPTTPARLEMLLQSLTASYHELWAAFVGKRDATAMRHEEITQRNGNSIPAFQNYERWLSPEALLGSSIVVQFAETLAGFEQDALCCALSSRMRSIGNVDVDVVRAEYRRTPRVGVDVLKLVQRALRRMILDIDQSISSHHDLVGSADDIQVIEASVLDARLAPASVDYIITSPPYGVEAVSYLRTHLLSYRCLQPILKHDPYALNDKIIGSEYVRESGAIDPNWGPAACSKTFVRFFGHDLAAEQPAKVVQRKHMMMQFFDDMVEVARRFQRFLRPGGRVAFVIGNKSIGGHVVPADAIISEIFDASGLRLDKTIAQKLKCNNSNSEVPWQERTIQDEFVMLFTRVA